MEHGKARESMLPSFFTEHELEIGDILLDLQTLIPLSNPEPVLEVPYWVNKKRKSNKCTPRSSSFYPWISSRHSTQIQPKVVNEVKTPSPVTPLAFPTDEYDQETKCSSKKRGRKEYIQQLTDMGEILKGEVEKVKNYYNQLKAENIELKEQKRKMLLKRKEEIKNKSLRHNIGFISSGQQFGICTQQQMNSLVLQDQQRQDQPSSSSSLRQPLGPLGIPDLNVSAEETFRLDSFQPLDKDTMSITRECPKEKRLIRRIIITKKRNGHR